MMMPKTLLQITKSCALAAVSGALLFSPSPAAAQNAGVKRIFFNAAGSPVNISRSVNGNQVFTDNRGRFAGATRRTPSGTLVYDNRRRLATVVRNTPSGALVIDRNAGVTSAIRRTPSGLAFTDNRGRITGGERDPFAAPAFSGLSSFDRPIGSGQALSVVTVEENSGVAAPGGLQIELPGVSALNVVLADMRPAAPGVSSRAIEGGVIDDRQFLTDPLAGSGQFATFPTGAAASCAGAGCESHGVGS